MEAYFKSHIRDVPDFPQSGIIFKDITTLLKDREAFSRMGKALTDFSIDKKIDKVVGIDSRGFIYGGFLANALDAGFVIIRKPGKLPSKTIKQEYTLEYGTDQLEIHLDAIEPGERVLIHDDLLATGGTAKAACELIEKAGGEVVQLSFLIELSFLNGRKKFGNYDISAAITY